ncbi:DUF2946 family protein [Ottowia thiooxydans]|uniref:DUF2946 domain-containing protein n=1 Tax=Ottowia thiooxydans TaxID=219182 RepID=A0ABV2Q221_9BURK
MHALRTSSVLSRLVLVWFMLMLGVATASPIVLPKASEIICTVGGAMKVVYLDDESQAENNVQHTLDCSLCLGSTLPLPSQSVVGTSAPAPLHLLMPELAAPFAALAGAPLPPRGPPALT